MRIPKPGEEFSQMVSCSSHSFRSYLFYTHTTIHAWESALDKRGADAFETITIIFCRTQMIEQLIGRNETFGVHRWIRGGKVGSPLSGIQILCVEDIICYLINMVLFNLFVRLNGRFWRETFRRTYKKGRQRGSDSSSPISYMAPQSLLIAIHT